MTIAVTVCYSLMLVIVACYTDLCSHCVNCVQMVSHPEVMRTLLSSPFVQQMMSSPDLMRQLMQTNPQLCEVMEVAIIYDSLLLHKAVWHWLFL